MYLYYNLIYTLGSIVWPGLTIEIFVSVIANTNIVYARPISFHNPLLLCFICFGLHGLCYMILSPFYANIPNIIAWQNYIYHPGNLIFMIIYIVHLFIQFVAICRSSSVTPVLSQVLGSCTLACVVYNLNAFIMSHRCVLLHLA